MLTPAPAIVKFVQWSVNQLPDLPSDLKMASMWDAPWWLWALVFLACFSVAQFLAWRESHNNEMALRAQLLEAAPQVILRYDSITDKYERYQAKAPLEDFTELTAINCSGVDAFGVYIARANLGKFRLASVAPLDRLPAGSERKLIYTVIDSSSKTVNLKHYAALNDLLDSLSVNGESFSAEVEIKYFNFHGRQFSTEVNLVYCPGLYCGPYFEVSPRADRLRGE
ncbi:MAG TPA: hypothetical protein VN622_13310 [Clostridia bacterium]|nr:hypothetical protein [Clostridia bacterium]